MPVLPGCVTPPLLVMSVLGAGEGYKHRMLTKPRIAHYPTALYIYIAARNVGVWTAASSCLLLYKLKPICDVCYHYKCLLSLLRRSFALSPRCCWPRPGFHCSLKSIQTSGWKLLQVPLKSSGKLHFIPAATVVQLNEI